MFPADAKIVFIDVKTKHQEYFQNLTRRWKCLINQMPCQEAAMANFSKSNSEKCPML